MLSCFIEWPNLYVLVKQVSELFDGNYFLFIRRSAAAKINEDGDPNR